MDVELLFFEGCPHWGTAAERLEQVATEAGLTVRYRRVDEGDDLAAGDGDA